jgi:tRNA dimethylallyltransferase
MITGDQPILALVGPTASGKTEVSLQVATDLGCEIVSCDSMSVYRGMDIGTAKPDAVSLQRVPHHMIGVVEPSERFSVARYQGLATDAIGGIRSRGRSALLVGGTGLYFRAVVDQLEFPGTDAAVRADLEAEAVAGIERLYDRLAGLDPPAAAKIEPNNVRRIVRALEVAAITGRPFSSFAQAWDGYPAGNVRAAGLEIDRALLGERIERRVRWMVDAGFADEVGSLVELGYAGWITSTQAIGYAEFAAYLEGASSLEDAISGTVRRSKALARRQVAWFRRDPRIRWFEVREGGADVRAIEEYLRDG